MSHSDLTWLDSNSSKSTVFHFCRGSLTRTINNSTVNLVNCLQYLSAPPPILPFFLTHVASPQYSERASLRKLKHWRKDEDWKTLKFTRAELIRRRQMRSRSFFSLSRASEKQFFLLESPSYCFMEPKQDNELNNLMALIPAVSLVTSHFSEVINSQVIDTCLCRFHSTFLQP